MKRLPFLDSFIHGPCFAAGRTYNIIYCVGMTNGASLKDWKLKWQHWKVRVSRLFFFFFRFSTQIFFGRRSSSKTLVFCWKTSKTFGKICKTFWLYLACKRRVSEPFFRRYFLADVLRDTKRPVIFRGEGNQKEILRQDVLCCYSSQGHSILFCHSCACAFVVYEAVWHRSTHATRDCIDSCCSWCWSALVSHYFTVCKLATRKQQ